MQASSRLNHNEAVKARKRLKLDPAGDRFQLLQPLAHGRQLDPGRDVAVGRLLLRRREFEPLQLQSAAPRPARRPAQHGDGDQRRAGDDHGRGHGFVPALLQNRRKQAGQGLTRIFFVGDTDEGGREEREDDFEQSPRGIVGEMLGGGVGLPWNLVVCMLIGVWLMGKPGRRAACPACQVRVPTCPTDRGSRRRGSHRAPCSTARRRRRCGCWRMPRRAESSR